MEARASFGIYCSCRSHTLRSRYVLIFFLAITGTSFVELLCFFCLVLAMPLCASVLCVLWSPAGKGLTSWLSYVVSNCEFVTFPLVS